MPVDEHDATGGHDAAIPAGHSAASEDAAQKSLVKAMLRMGITVDDIAAELARRYGQRPRRAYRIARGLTPHGAVQRFNDYVAGTEAQPAAGLTVAELEGYESTADGGSLPSLATLTLLAQVYETDVRNLVDFDDRVRLPLRDRAFLDRQSRPGSESGQSVSALLIGQATALLALAVAVIYAAGDLDLGFKLWFLRDTWGPVLSGLPRDLVLVSAISDTIPALIAALPVYYFYRKCRPLIGRLTSPRFGWKMRVLRPILRTLLLLLLVAILSLVPVLFISSYTNELFYKDVLQSLPRIFMVCFAINLVVVGLASLALWLVGNRGPVLRHSLSVAVIGIALIPCVASVYATYPLPQVVLCGSAFSQIGTAGRHYVIGNLIGDSGQWAYVAETREFNGTAVGAYISEVPLSAVDLETIGPSANCNDLAPVQGGPKPSMSATATPSPQ